MARYIEMPDMAAADEPAVDHVDDAPPPAPQGQEDLAAVAAPQPQAALGGDAAAAAPPPGDPAIQQDADNAEYLDKMRGWLMTVATLFAGFAFHAAMHPPAWMGNDAYRQVFTRNGSYTAGLFVVSNLVTFATAMVLVVLLLHIKRAPSTLDMGAITFMLSMIAFFVVMMFTFAVSSEWAVARTVLYALFAYGIVVGVFVIYGARLRTYLRRHASSAPLLE